MKWFKHFTNARDNHKIEFVSEKLGEAGYARVFKIYEIVAERWEPPELPELKLNGGAMNLGFISKKLGISLEEAEKTLNIFAKAGVIDKDAWKKKVLYIPQLMDYKDNTTSRELRRTKYVLSTDEGRLEKTRLEEEETREDKKAIIKPKDLPNWMYIECRKVLGLKPEPAEWRKSEIEELEEVYGNEKVAEVFTRWLESQKGRELQKPLLEFIKVADALLRGILVIDDPELDELNAKLHEMGGSPFSGKYRTDLSQMRKIYSDSEIEHAYRELINNRDEFQMKFSVRDFCEGGGVAIILARRKEQEEAEKSQAESSAMRKAAREQVERELAEMEAETEPEDDFFKIGV